MVDRHQGLPPEDPLDVAEHRHAMYESELRDQLDLLQRENDGLRQENDALRGAMGCDPPVAEPTSAWKLVSGFAGRHRHRVHRLRLMLRR